MQILKRIVMAALGRRWCLQVIKRIVTVVSRWRWVADGGAVFWGMQLPVSMIISAVLLGNASAGCQTQLSLWFPGGAGLPMVALCY